MLNTGDVTISSRKDAQVLLDGGEKSWGTEKSQFRKILCVRSIPQLNCIFQEYSKICKYTIGESIKREMSGQLKPQSTLGNHHECA